MLPHLPFLPWPPSYGLLVACGFVAALLVLRRLAPAAGVDRALAEDVAVWACLWGLVGAKLVLVVLEPATYFASPLGLLTEGGVFYGGLIAAAGSVLWQCWRRGLDPHALGDACAPALAVGHAFGRVGCFLAGCCWGRASDVPWAVRFTDPESLPVRSLSPLAGVPVHPVQLYEVAANVLLAVASAWWLLRRRPFPGGVWWAYAGAYGLMRVGLETLRGDAARGTLLSGAVSTSQGIGLAVAALSFGIWTWRFRAAQRRRRAAALGPPTADVPLRDPTSSP